MGNELSHGGGEEVRTLESAAFQISEGARALGQSVRPLANRWAANEERWQRTQQRLDTLETTVEAMAVFGADGEEAVKRLEVRMSTLESSLEKALNSMFPRVEALLSQLEHRESQKNKTHKNIKERFLQNDSFAVSCKSGLPPDTSSYTDHMENILLSHSSRDVSKTMTCELSTKDGHSSGFVSKPSSPIPKKQLSVHRPIVLNCKPSYSSNNSASSGTKPASGSKIFVSGANMSSGKSKVALTNHSFISSSVSVESVPHKSKPHTSSKEIGKNIIPSHETSSLCSTSELRSVGKNIHDNSDFTSSQSLRTDSATSSETVLLTSLPTNDKRLDVTVTSTINHSPKFNSISAGNNQILVKSSSIGSFSSNTTSSSNSTACTTIAISSSMTPSISKACFTSKPSLLSPTSPARKYSKTFPLNTPNLQSSVRKSSRSLPSSSMSNSIDPLTSLFYSLISIRSKSKTKGKSSSRRHSTKTLPSSAPPSTMFIPIAPVSSTLSSTVLPKSTEPNSSIPESLSSYLTAPDSTDSITTSSSVSISLSRNLAYQNSICPNLSASKSPAHQSSYQSDESNVCTQISNPPNSKTVTTPPNSTSISSVAAGSSLTDPEYLEATVNVQKEAATFSQAVEIEPEVAGLVQVVNAVPRPGQQQVAVAETRGRSNVYGAFLRSQSRQLESGRPPLSSRTGTEDATPLQSLEMETRDGVQSQVSAEAEEVLQAAQSGDEERVVALLDAGSDVNASCGGSGPYAITVVHWAAARSRPQLLQLLLERGGDPHGRNGAHWTPLHAAAYGGSPRCVHLLVAAGADVNCTDDDGWTPLHLAAVRARSAATRALLAAGARRSARDRDGKTPFQMATTEAVRHLLAEDTADD